MTDVNKYLRHGTSDPLIQTYMRRSAMPILQLPICPKCEAIALRTKGWTEHKIVKCPRCNYEGPATHQLSTYLKEGCYK